MEKKLPQKKKWINAGFVVLCAGILLFLYLAPEETTSPLPNDEVHLKFHQIESKKEADKLCSECHNQDGEMVLPDDHPDPFRCLFCHKR